MRTSASRIKNNTQAPDGPEHVTMNNDLNRESIFIHVHAYLLLAWKDNETKSPTALRFLCLYVISIISVLIGATYET